jgi:hypothetical protein
MTGLLSGQNLFTLPDAELSGFSCFESAALPPQGRQAKIGCRNPLLASRGHGCCPKGRALLRRTKPAL